MTIFLDYAERGKTAWWRYPLAFALALVFTVIIYAVVVTVMILSHRDPAIMAAELRQPSHPTAFFQSVGLVFLAILLGFIGAIRLVHGKRFGDIIGCWDWRMFLLGAGLWLTFQIVASGADYLISPRAFRVTAQAATLSLALWAIPALAIQTFTEEFLFRGYLTQAFLRATRRPAVSAVVSGLLFGALHIPNGIPVAISAVVFGIVTALITIRTGGVALAYGLHLVNNLFAAIVVVSGGDVFKGSPGLFSQSSPQLMGLDVALELFLLLAVLWLTGRRWPFPPAISPRPS